MSKKVKKKFSWHELERFPTFHAHTKLKPKEQQQQQQVTEPAPVEESRVAASELFELWTLLLWWECNQIVAAQLKAARRTQATQTEAIWSISIVNCLIWLLQATQTAWRKLKQLIYRLLTILLITLLLLILLLPKQNVRQALLTLLNC
ncbi:uncharacterized protein LOC108599354 [Drosophila busckii]|uniref:uncharacterized protein LOC108599354 n=1 Tax=Drosophila busckii TaxID=30019 RepID=UPI00083EF2E7|nr:uncharacterized protein LOC108599354 [Drosophila busckii]